jgi:hypothetical protein
MPEGTRRIGSKMVLKGQKKPSNAIVRVKQPIRVGSK